MAASKNSERGTGALPEKPDVNDYRYEELANTEVFKAAPVWEPLALKTARVDAGENTKGKIKVYGEINDQASSGSCVSQTVAKLLGVENLLEEGKFLELSARSIYPRGFVPPDGGMYPRDGMKIGSENGATLKALLASDLLGEDAMRKLDGETNVDRLIGKIVRGGVFVAIPINLDAVAAVLARGKAIAMSIRFNGDLDPKKPVLAKNGRYGHEILLTTNGLVDAKRVGAYQNSWGKGWGFGGAGIIPEDQFLGGGVDSLWYYENLPNIGGTSIKPAFVFKKALKLGMTNSDVAMLQRCLGYLSDAAGYLFPLTQAPTGYYGGITGDAVRRYQLMRGLAQTGLVDAATIVALNKDFA